MPVLTPPSSGSRAGVTSSTRSSGSRTATDAEYVLPMTHEETVTFHARELQSYRQLPQMLYHFRIKERDEPRPRGGLIRVREFIMKDAYSFDRDEAGLERSFSAQRGAYHRIFERCGLEVHAVEAESGMMGGSGSIDFLAPARLRREHARRLRERRLRRRHRGRARHPAAARVPGAPRRAGGGRDARRDDDRGARRAPRDRRGGDVEGDAAREADGTVVLALDPRRRPARGDEARRRASGDVPPATEEEIRAAFGADPAARSARSASRARSSPTRRCARGSSSRAPTATAGTCAASRPAATTRRGSPTCGRRREDDRARAAAAAALPDRDRGRPHLQARDALLGAARRDLPRRGRRERPLVMGSYGIGPAA